jgi:hypothetical protein
MVRILVTAVRGAHAFLQSFPSTSRRRSAAAIRDAARGGEVIIAGEARFTTACAVQRFDATNQQVGYSGSVVLGNGGLDLE